MTSSTPTTNLFQMLPSVYRIRDGLSGGALENLMAILQDAHDAIDADIAQMYENWFIETCAEWVVPYLGDLLKSTVLESSDLAGVTLRGYVASTLSYRRRKGTTVVLEQLARDITNWPAVAVEGYQLLATTQYMQHLRPGNVVTMDMRDGDALAALGGAWDRAARTADLRGIESPSIRSMATSGDPGSGTQLYGRANLTNIAIFLWRIESFALNSVTPRAVTAGADGRYRFHPLGIDAPLFGNGSPLPQFTQPAGPQDIPGPLLLRALAADLEALRQSMVDNGSLPGVAGTATYASIYFGAAPVLQVLMNGLPIAPEKISICDLSDVDAAGNWRTLPASRTYTRSFDGTSTVMPIQACVDPVLGRLAFPASAPAGSVTVDFSYGFSGEMGGGPYDRTASLRGVMTGIDPTDDTDVYWQALVDVTGRLARADYVYPDLASAVAAWNALPPSGSSSPGSSTDAPRPGRFGVIVLPDSRTYTAPTATIEVADGESLLLVGATWPTLESLSPTVSFAITAGNCRPHILGDLQVAGTAPSTSANPGTLLLNGILLEGSLRVMSGNLGKLQIDHTTVSPLDSVLQVLADASGLPGLQNTALSVVVNRSIVGPVVFADGTGGAPTIAITDSIVDAAGAEAIHAPEADATLSGCTILGTIGLVDAIGLRTLSASNVIFTGVVNVERVQSGCLRYCSLPPQSVSVPRRFRCQPDLAAAAVSGTAAIAAVQRRLTPSFTSTQFGDPAYGQLSATCAPEIRAGADDGSEMGSFGFLEQPQRDANLRSVLPEYLLPAFGAGIFYMS
ncbi:hypothetical protein FTO74_12590 [Granulicella sp. WH15]|uniref:hypothetical protein n=1 Tax=Granulicella sp. WH15 TaxID=2602070 RepID=UPI0013668A5B|nr:hypothetical protein [Granulicella sp. WH15]QHN04114.1 hypothetical protein FTO74_12590 [Granulicella sp. WH15]